MQEHLDKYKYHIGGTSIALILLYVLYDTFKKETSVEIVHREHDKSDKPMKADISHDEFLLFMKTLKGELQSLTQSMIQFNANNIKTHSNYKDFRDKLFTKDIVKKNILIDSVSVAPNDTSNYIVNFGTDIYGEVFKNVIGFRLVDATLPNSLHNVTTHNQKVYYSLAGDKTFDLTKGSYTFDKFGQEFIRALKLEPGCSAVTLASDKTTYKYTLTGLPVGFRFRWKTGSLAKSAAYLLLGALNENDATDLLTPYTFPNGVDQTVHFVDLVIPEIPDIACKMASNKQVIDRIPLNTPSGSLVHYRAPEHELQTENYFYPMKLSTLTIQLYDNDVSEFYKCENGHNYFQFEITMVKNTGLFK